MTIKRLLLGLILACLQHSASAWDGPRYRDYATVLAVEPIVETAYRPSVRRVCQRRAAIDEPLAQSIGEDIRRQMQLRNEQLDCHSVRELQAQDEISGYRVTYQYGDRTVTRRLPYDPGDRLAVDIRVNPLP